MATSLRRERLDRGIKVRSDDIFAIASYREMLYLALPRTFAVLALLAFPLLGPWTGPYWRSVMLITLVISLLALSWDLMASVGLLSLGQAFFFGVGGYLAGFLNQTLGWSPLLTIPTATVVGACVCLLFLYPVLRLRGIYFGLITFALPLLLSRTIEATKILGGTEGMTAITPLANMTLELYMLLAVVLLCVFGFQRLLDTDYGLVLQAIADNDRSVIASGISIQMRKAQAVFIAALPGTFVGAFLTHHYQFVGMPAFALDYSILPLTSVVIGGPGTVVGAMVGAFILVPLSEVLRGFGSLRVVIYSLLLVIFSVGLPEGIFHFIRRKYHQFERYVSLE